MIGPPRTARRIEYWKRAGVLISISEAYGQYKRIIARNGAGKVVLVDKAHSILQNIDAAAMEVLKAKICPTCGCRYEIDQKVPI